MWKEKYEALKTDYDQLVESHDALARRLSALEHPVSSQNSVRRTDSAAETAAEATSFPTTPKIASAAPKNGDAAYGEEPKIPIDLIRAAFIRLAQEDPPTAAVVAQLTQSHPELRVTKERRVLEMNASDTPGRIALLLSENYFDTPRDQSDVTKEFKRRGWFEAKTSNAAIIKPMAKLTEWGFFTKEEDGYKAVAGMKVRIVEVQA